MQIDVNRLKGKTVELGLTGAAVAEKLGIDQSTYYRKLGAGGGSFTIAQAQMISKILELSPNECSTIFWKQTRVNAIKQLSERKE